VILNRQEILLPPLTVTAVCEEIWLLSVRHRCFKNLWTNVNKT